MINPKNLFATVFFIVNIKGLTANELQKSPSQIIVVVPVAGNQTAEMSCTKDGSASVDAGYRVEIVLKNCQQTDRSQPASPIKKLKIHAFLLEDAQIIQTVVNHSRQTLRFYYMGNPINEIDNTAHWYDKDLETILVSKNSLESSSIGDLLQLEKESLLDKTSAFFSESGVKILGRIFFPNGLEFHSLP